MAVTDSESPSVTPGVQPPNGTELSILGKRTGGFADRVVKVRLGDIQGEHSLVRDLGGVLTLPYVQQSKFECFPSTVVSDLIERSPLLIYQERHHIFCIGNICLFRMARAILDPNESVSTISLMGKLDKNSRERLRQGLLIETFLFPAVFGRRASDLKALSTAWEKAAEAKMLKFWPCESFDWLYRKASVLLKQKRAPHLV